MASVIGDEIDSESLACPLCFLEFDSPRVLPCLHTFCEKCLDTHIKLKAKDDSQFLCPICKIPTLPPDHKLPVEKWATAFPLNNILLYMIAASDGSEDSDDLCQPCKVQGNENKAKVWCKDCQEQLCSSCNDFHKAIKILQQHKTVSIDKKHQHRNVSLNFIQQCIHHRGQRLEMFCTDHREVCCAQCVTATHRECQNICCITDITKETTKQLSSENISENMKEILIQIDKLTILKLKSIEEIGKEKEKLQRDIDAEIDKAIGKLNEVRKKFKAETDQCYQEAKCFLQQNDRSIQSFVKNLTNSRNIFGHLEKSFSPEQMFIIYENFRSQIMSHYQQLKTEIQNPIEEAHLILKPSSFFEDFEKSLGHSLGNIEKITGTSTICNDPWKNIDDVMTTIDLRTKLMKPLCTAPVETADLMTSSVTFVKAVRKQELGDRAYWSGGTFLPDGRLLMVDRNNKQLIEMNDAYNIVRKYDMDINPIDVAAGNENQELYASVNENQIYRCMLDTKLTVTSKFKGPVGTWGIAVSATNVIVAGEVKVLILGLDGSMVRSIPVSFIDMFCFVAVSRSRDTFYHREKGAIICRTMDGNELFRYSDQELKRPRGIYIDIYGDIYVSSRKPNKIHQISSDGKRSRILLNKLQTISEPISVVFSSQRNELIVTSLNEDTVFEVYRLQY